MLLIHICLFFPKIHPPQNKKTWPLAIMDYITCWLVGNAVFNELAWTFRARNEARMRAKAGGEGENKKANGYWEEEIQNNS